MLQIKAQQMQRLSHQTASIEQISGAINVLVALKIADFANYVDVRSG